MCQCGEKGGFSDLDQKNDSYECDFIRQFVYI